MKTRGIKKKKRGRKREGRGRKGRDGIREMASKHTKCSTL